MSIPFTRHAHFVGTAAAPLYYQLPLGVISAGVAQTLNLQHFLPVRIDSKGVIKTVGCSVSSTVANAVSRVGVYKDAGTAGPRPGELIAQVSSAFATAALGAPEGTVNATIKTPGLYWLSIVTQTAAATLDSIQRIQLLPLPFGTTKPTTFGTVVGYTRASVSSTMSDVLPTTSLSASQVSPWLFYSIGNA